MLHVVIESSGRIVTAYPVRGLTSAGSAAAFVLVTLDEATAEARSRLDRVEIEAHRRLDAAEPSFAEEVFWDIVTFGLHGGSLNVGEDVHLWADRQLRQIQQEACAAVVTAVQESEQRSLGGDETTQICDLVTVALAHPDLLDELDDS